MWDRLAEVLFASVQHLTHLLHCIQSTVVFLLAGNIHRLSCVGVKGWQEGSKHLRFLFFKKIQNSLMDVLNHLFCKCKTSISGMRLITRLSPQRCLPIFLFTRASPCLVCSVSSGCLHTHYWKALFLKLVQKSCWISSICVQLSFILPTDKGAVFNAGETISSDSENSGTALLSRSNFDHAQYRSSAA